MAITAAVAWRCAVATGAIFVAVGVFAAKMPARLPAAMIRMAQRGDYRRRCRDAQVPYAIHQVSTHFRDSAWARSRAAWRITEWDCLS